jgi:hypothetical protein
MLQRRARYLHGTLLRKSPSKTAFFDMQHCTKTAPLAGYPVTSHAGHSKVKRGQAHFSKLFEAFKAVLVRE